MADDADDDEIGTRSVERSGDGTGLNTLLWPFDIRIAAEADPATIVLKSNGRKHRRFPLLKFEITEGPPGYSYDIHVARGDPNLLQADRGGPADGLWNKSNRRRERTASVFYSSWADGHRGTLDGSGAASFTMPERWWRDMAAIPLTDWDDWNARPRNPHLKFFYRVIAFDSTDFDRVYSTRDAQCASAPFVTIQNNLLRFRVHRLRYARDVGTNVWRRHCRITHYVRERNTTDMYTMVQWKRGGRTTDGGAVAPGITVQDYNMAHASTYPTWQIDRVRLNPRYWDGTPHVAANGRRAWYTDGVSARPLAGGAAMRLIINFVSRIHLNADVPAQVTIDNAASTFAADGSRLVYKGVISNRSARPIRGIYWAARMRVWRDAAGAHFQQL